MLAAIREYQKADTDVSAFAIPYFINALYKNTDSKDSSADNEKNGNRYLLSSTRRNLIMGKLGNEKGGSSFTYGLI